MAATTFVFRPALTLPRSFRTFDTVPTDTRARRATSSFVGYSNFLRAATLGNAGDATLCSIAGTTCTPGTRTIGGGEGTVEIAIRPERLRLAVGRDGAVGVNRIPGIVRSIAYEGAMLTYDIVLADGQPVLAREPNAGEARLARRHAGERVEVEWNPADAVLIR